MELFRNYPLKFETFVTALEEAKEESRNNPDDYIYLLWNNAGHYTVDNIHMIGDDEKKLKVFKNGEEL